jgi:uncharacterized repeat protein (TIGR01451 family)
VTAPDVGGAINNSAAVSSATSDPNTGNNSDSESTTVNPVADLALTKSDGPDPVEAAESLTYTLSVSNAGPSGADSLTVTDTLPAGVTFVSADGSGWSCGETAGVVTCTRAALAVGAAPDITIQVTAIDNGGIIENTATVGSLTDDPNSSNDTDIEQTTVNARADLSIVKSDSADPVEAQAALTYTLVVSNAGPSKASSVSVVDTLPVGAGFVGASGDGWSCGESGGVVTCTRASLAVGSAPVITIQVTTPATAGTIENSATVSSDASDPNVSNNSDSEQTTVNLPLVEADLSIVKTDGPDPVDAAATLTYTLTIANAGPDGAESVSVSDTLPAGVTYVNASGDGWSCSHVGGVVSCTRASLAVGTAPAITIQVTAPNEGGALDNLAGVSSATSDPNTDNNSDSEATTVNPMCDLALTKSDGPDPVDAAATLTYTLGASNAGPSTAEAVSVSDTLPAGVSYVSASGDGWSCDETAGVVTCTRAALSVGAAPDITIQVTAPDDGGVINNSAAISAAPDDPNPANDTDIEETTVNLPVFAADLAIGKSDGPDPVDAGATLTYTLQVGNAGPDAAENVSVSDALPVGVTFVSASGSGWSCDETGGVVTCTRASLAVGSAPVIIIQVTAPATDGVISNSATISSETADPNPSDNSGSEDTTVVPVSGEVHDLAIVRLHAPPNVLVTGSGRSLRRNSFVRVQIQNRSPHVETIPDRETLASLVTLEAASLGTCPDLDPVLIKRTLPRGFPLRFEPKQRLHVFFLVQFPTGCINDPERSTGSDPGHDDYVYTARVTRSVLDGEADSHPVDDVCPRSVTPPGVIDPYPDGTIIDKGCGRAKADGTFGDPVVTDLYTADGGRPRRGPAR